jgi:hypothetical protein
MYLRRSRRWFVVAYWLVILAALAVLWQFPIPPDASHPGSFAMLLVTLCIAGNLPLVLGGFSHGGAVAFYEGRPLRSRAGAERWVKRHPILTRMIGLFRRFLPPERVRRFVAACRPVDEREAQLRDWAFHRGFRLMMWLVYGAAVAYLVMARANASLLPRFGFLVLELLLVASLSLPQCLLLWTIQDLPQDLFPTGGPTTSLEATCEPN